MKVRRDRAMVRSEFERSGMQSTAANGQALTSIVRSVWTLCFALFCIWRK
jgi:hypothetical protein